MTSTTSALYRAFGPLTGALAAPTIELKSLMGGMALPLLQESGEAVTARELKWLLADMSNYQSDADEDGSAYTDLTGRMIRVHELVRQAGGFPVQD